MLTIWSLCLLHKSGPVVCNVCLSCPYSAFSMEGVWVTLRKSLTRSPTSGSEGVKKIFVLLGPGNLWDSLRVPRGSVKLFWLMCICQLASGLTEICQPTIQCFWLGKLGPRLPGAEVPWGWGSLELRFWSAFLKTTGPENSLVFHLAVKHWTTFIISRVYICVVSPWVSRGAYYCSMAHQVHCS